ncbi:hypothetical protein BDZ45DRAFT_754438 [Acephala macrosclerotiorum]|nr:hypothetical protein BDZ45DRAFT_754438 [Acephala macrosclerotiorum]
MFVDPTTFKISFLVADMLSGRFDSSPLPELTSEEIEQLRQQLVQAKNALAAENESPDESLQANCRLNQEIARLDELERGEVGMQGILVAGRPTSAEPASHHDPPKLDDDFEDSESLYEDASSVSDTLAVDGSSDNSTRVNPPSPADPVLNLLEQASALLRERPDFIRELEVSGTPNQLPQAHTSIQPMAIPADANRSSGGHRTSFMGFDWKMPPLWITGLIIWCLWVTWSQAGSLLAVFELLAEELQGLRNKMVESVLGCLGDLALAYLSWRDEVQHVQMADGL